MATYRFKKRRARSSALSLLELQLRAASVPKAEREYKFHPTRRWRFDFAWPEFKIALEFEGGAFTPDERSHARGIYYTKDCIKYSEAAILGWVVIRVTAPMVKNGTALDLIQRALKER